MFSLSLAISLATAAELTDMPPEMRGDVDIGYTGSFGIIGLEEAYTERPGGPVEQEYVASGTLFRHDVVFAAEFAPIAGIAVTLAMPITPSWSISWSEARKMAYDPVRNTGSYIDQENLNDPPTIRASGSEGLWLGAAFAPFSSTFGGGLLKQEVDWRLSAQFRTPSGRTLWSAPDGRRGVAPGGSAWKFTAAFSTRRGASSPYLVLDALLEGRPVNVDVIDEAGTTWATGLPVDAASRVDVRAGVELLDDENPEAGYRFVWDLYCGFGYTTWQDVPSGIFLPSVLDASRTIAVTESDYVRGKVGMAAIVDVNKYFGMRIGVEGAYDMPHTVENVYKIRTSADSLEILAHLSVEGRAR